MKEYQVYYKGLYIGRLIINEDGQYIYYLNDHFKTSCFFSDHPLREVLTSEQTEFGPPIEFFSKIIFNLQLLGDLYSCEEEGVRLRRIG